MKVKKQNLLYLYLLIIISIFPVLFLYLNNISEVSIKETIIPILVFVFIPLSIYLILLIFKKNSIKNAISILLCISTLYNFKIIEKGFQIFFKELKYWHILGILIFVIFHGIFFIKKIKDEEVLQNILKIITIVITGLILFNLVTNFSDIRNSMSKNKGSNLQNNNEKLLIGDSTNMPNVYYLLFDEYAGFSQMKKYYNYDNKELSDYLKKNNFNISLDSHNDTIKTDVVMTNIVNFDYISDFSNTVEERAEWRKNGELFKLFKEKGYRIEFVGNEDFYGVENNQELSGGSVGKTVSGDSFFDILIKRTAIYPFYKKVSRGITMKMYQQIEHMNSIEVVSEEPTLVWFHFDLPHEPFMVDENGNNVPPDQYANWEDDRYYKGQFIYTTKIMINILKNILKNDPASIIIVQSDHGARASSDLDLFMDKFELNEMNNILNIVYYQGEELAEIENESGVNTVRVVLNRLFELDMEKVEVPVDEHVYNTNKGK